MIELYKQSKPVVELQKYFSIVHLYYGHKYYYVNDTIHYDEENIKTINNTFSRIARWLLYDHEDPFK